MPPILVVVLQVMPPVMVVILEVMPPIMVIMLEVMPQGPPVLVTPPVMVVMLEVMPPVMVVMLEVVPPVLVLLEVIPPVLPPVMVLVVIPIRDHHVTGDHLVGEGRGGRDQACAQAEHYRDRHRCKQHRESGEERYHGTSLR